jgi:hypothetical protein
MTVTSPVSRIALRQSHRDPLVKVECRSCSRQSIAFGGYERRLEGRVPTTLPDQKCPRCGTLLDAAPVLGVLLP